MLNRQPWNLPLIVQILVCRHPAWNTKAKRKRDLAVQRIQVLLVPRVFHLDPLIVVTISMGFPLTRTRSSSREVRIRKPFFSVVYFSRGALPTKTTRVRKGTTGGPSCVAVACRALGSKARALLSSAALSGSPTFESFQWISIAKTGTTRFQRGLAPTRHTKNTICTHIYKYIYI